MVSVEGVWVLAHVRDCKPLARPLVSGSRQFRLGAEPQVIREQDGDEQQRGQRQSPSLGPLRLVSLMERDERRGGRCMRTLSHPEVEANGAERRKVTSSNCAHGHLRTHVKSTTFTPPTHSVSVEEGDP
ncbi:hypothetical protein INR49_021927, partial [Caranx melampygus]